MTSDHVLASLPNREKNELLFSKLDAVARSGFDCRTFVPSGRDQAKLMEHVKLHAFGLCQCGDYGIDFFSRWHALQCPTCRPIQEWEDP